MKVPSILPRPRIRTGGLWRRRHCDFELIPRGHWMRGSSSLSSPSPPPTVGQPSPPSPIVKRRHSFRRRSQSSLPPKSKTLKDRLKSRTPRLPLIHKWKMDEQLLAERMETRLEWARQTLWENTEWLMNRMGSSNTATTTTIHNQVPNLRRRLRLRYETPMDANWWFWNLLLAATPSLIIAGYCEGVVKPKMKKQQQQQQDGTMIASPLSSTPPTPTLTWSETWDMLLLWVQGHEPATTSPPGDTPTKSSSTTPTSVPTSPQQLTERFHELQQQMLLLEQQLKNHQQQHQQEQPHGQQSTLSSNSETTTSTMTRTQIQSPLQQRRQERQLQRQMQTKERSDMDTLIKTDNGAEIVPTHNQHHQQHPQEQPPYVPTNTNTSSSNNNNNQNNKQEEQKEPLPVIPYSGSWHAGLSRLWKWITPPRDVVSNQDGVEKDPSPVPSPE